MNRVFFTNILIVALVLSSCATIKPPIQKDLYTYLGSSADIYCVVPVKQNKALVERLATVWIQKQDDKNKSINSFIDRCDLAYVGIYEQKIIAVLQGNFPKQTTSLLLSSQKGWKTKKNKTSGTWFVSDSLAVKIPSSNLIFAVLSTTETDTINFPLELLTDFAPARDFTIKPSFLRYIENASLDERIGLYIQNPQKIQSALFGPLFEIPVTSADIFLTHLKTSDDYNLSSTITVTDERFMRAFLLLVRLGLGFSARTEGTNLLIDNFPVTIDQLADFSQIVYFD